MQATAALVSVSRAGRTSAPMPVFTPSREPLPIAARVKREPKRFPGTAAKPFCNVVRFLGRQATAAPIQRSPFVAKVRAALGLLH